MRAEDDGGAQRAPATGYTLDDAAFLLDHFADANARPEGGASPEAALRRDVRIKAFRDAAYHCRALLAGDPRSVKMLARLRREAGPAPAAEDPVVLPALPETP